MSMRWGKFFRIISETPDILRHLLMDVAVWVIIFPHYFLDPRKSATFVAEYISQIFPHNFWDPRNSATFVIKSFKRIHCHVQFVLFQSWIIPQNILSFSAYFLRPKKFCDIWVINSLYSPTHILWTFFYKFHFYCILFCDSINPPVARHNIVSNLTLSGPRGRGQKQLQMWLIVIKNIHSHSI